MLSSLLGNKWRVDSSYEEACDEIITAVFPEELAALTNGDGGPDPEQVRTWFEHKGFGQSNARSMSSTYILIAGKVIPEAPPSEPTKKPATKKVKNDRAPAGGVKPNMQTPVVQPPPSNQDGPSLHIDIQIHVPADADADQIDQIFASMARHLYSQRAGE